MSDSPIDEVLDAIRAAMMSRRSEAADRVARIKAAADAYLQATEQDIAAQFAARHGLEVPQTNQPLRAALDLRAAVEALPESHVRPGPPSVWSTPRASVPPSTDARSGRDAAPELPLDQATEDFVREVRASSLDEMPTELFRVHAEEFAARARHLQQVFADRPGDVDAIGRVIRTLTAMVAKRGLTGIYGLSRSHSADWQARADEAARRRQRLLSIPPNAPLPRALGRGDDAGERELEASNDGGGGGSGGGDDEGEERTSGPPPSDPPLEFEHLRAANVDGPVVIVGGTAKPEKLERLRRRTDLELEWVGVDPGSTQPILTLERRIRDGRLGAVVVLQDLMAHKHFEPLLTAARQVGVPWAYGGKAGKASLERALGELDAMVAQRKG